VSARAANTQRRRLWWTILALFLGLLAPEVILRFLIFSDSDLARTRGAGLREPANFAEARLDDEFWRLNWKLQGKKSGTGPLPSHELLGWTGHTLDAESLLPRLAEPLEGRRPVLLYGASYASCVVPAEDCFQGLMAASDLAGKYVLHNLGVGGYGIDQILLLMQATLDHYKGQNPIVIVMPVLDSDFNRASLSFRSRPKPRFRQIRGKLQPIEPVFMGGPDAYLESHGVGITSYVWNYLTHGANLLPRAWKIQLQGREQRFQEQGNLVNAILDQMHVELKARELDSFFVLCTSPRGLPPNGLDAMERRVVRRFLMNGEAFLSSREFIEAALEAGPLGMSELFITRGTVGRNHPTAEGNKVLFKAIRAGLAGQRTTDQPF
jgi:hypothetical protein